MYHRTRPTTNPVRTRRSPRRRRLAGAALLVAVLAWTQLHGSLNLSFPAIHLGKSSPCPRASATGATDLGLLTPAGARTVVLALRSAMGGTELNDFRIYLQYALADRPNPADPLRVDHFEYRGGKVARSALPSGASTNDRALDLQSVDWDALPALLRKADQDLCIASPTTHYIHLYNDSEFDGPKMEVRAADATGLHHGYLLTDLKGHLIRAYPEIR